MDIEELVKKYKEDAPLCSYDFDQSDAETMLSAALTELAAEYENRIDALMVSHTEQMQELQRDKEYCCCGECTTLTPSTVAEREALQERIRQLEAEWVPAQQYTTGHCANKAQPGGGQWHNLHCNYPICDRRHPPCSRRRRGSDVR